MSSSHPVQCSVARELARFAVETPHSDIPPRALEHGEMLLASTIASAAVGTGLLSSRVIREVEMERGGHPQSTLWFAGGAKLPVAATARVNALASDAAASDDSDLRNIVHQGTTACATATAAGEHAGASGAEVLAAIVLGYEVAGHVSTAVECGFRNKGFHGCIVACFASTAAAARLLKLDVEQTAHAIALTATSIGGISALADTSSAREYHAGQAALVGVNAVQAAARGYSADAGVFEMANGFFDTISDHADAAAIRRDLGKRWNILEHLGIKLMPGGHPHHAVAEAAARAAVAADVHPQDVDSIEVGRIGFAYANASAPTDLVGMAHSAYFFAAAGVADRGFTWAHASQEKILDPVIQGLLGKVRMVAAPTKDLELFHSGAVVTIRTRDGRSHSATVHAPKGAARHGIAWSDVEEKYRTLISSRIDDPARVDASLRAIRGLRRADGVSELLDRLQ